MPVKKIDMGKLFSKSVSVLVLLLCRVGLSAAPIVVGDWSELDTESVLPGTEIVLGDHLYADTIIRIKFSGTKEKPIIIRAGNPGKVVFSGASRIDVFGSYLDISGLMFDNPSPTVGTVFRTRPETENVHIHNCCIRSDETPETVARFSKTKYHWMHIQGCHHEIDHCSFVGKYSIGLMLNVQPADEKTPMYCSVHNNYFSRPGRILTGRGSTVNGQESFRIGLSQTCWCDARCEVRDNWFYRCNGEVEVISNKCCGNLYERNLLERCEGMLTLRHGNNCTVRGNIILGEGVRRSGGIRIIGSGHTVEGNIIKGVTGRKVTAAIAVSSGSTDPGRAEYWPADNCTVSNNVVIDCAEALAVNFKTSLKGQTAPKNLVVKKNRFICGAGSNSVSLFAIPQKDITFRANSIYGGIQSGCELKTARRRPSEPDYAPAADSIRSGAGCSFLKPGYGPSEEY